ncbi:prohead protease/major capsid protein fusion protein [Limnohabitans lacus]|uniref:Peptidase U35 n=1 Tax=Limnohabitans lacus TaxID=3045173 RepID=A0ABT6X883_9BURK|nr:prohead protease/major capsid protein fusion protein [Limnohabitans sp. HM2-2]MDI9234320.1 peptidase U35 [Limnohabitans sp. HM2-2]
MPQANAPGAQPRAPDSPTTRTQDMPLASLQMAVRNVRRDAPPDQATRAEGDAATQAPAARFEIVFTTGAPVKRYDWANGRYYLEQLEVSEQAIDLSRLERGAPLLNTHNAWDLEDQLGVCDQPEIRNGQGVCQSQLSRRDSVKGVVQDLEDGVIRNVSVGYSRNAVEMVAPSEDAGMWVYRVTRWTPMEVSLVPIPADMDSQVVRSEGGNFKAPDGRELRAFPCVMTEVTTRTHTNTEQQPAAPAAAQQSTTAVATADVSSTRNFESTTMTPEEIAAAAAATSAANATRAATTVEAEAARQAGMQAERQRSADIRTAVDAARSTLGTEADALAIRLIDAGVTVDQARAQILDALAEASRAQSVRGATHVTTVRDEQDTLRTRMSDALVLRNNPNATEFAGTKIDVAGARNFRGMDLMDMARRSIAAAGGNADGLSRREIAMAALNLDADARRNAGMMGTSDFPAILASTVNRSLRAAYEQAPRTFTGWARQSTNKDFREKSLLQLSGMSQFKKINEGGEYKLATFSDTAEKYSLSKYGAIIAITWEALINDDLSAFSRIPMMIAEEAAALEGDLVYAALIGSPAMADGVALFHANHKNLAGSAGAISDVTLGAGRAAMRKQTGANGRVLNLAPEILIVGPDKEAEALKYTSSNFVAAKSVDINPAFNTSLSVIVDNRVTGNQWYLASSPNRVDTVEYAYLEGENGLFTTRREGFEVDGVEIKARHVFAAKAIDHRGLYKNAGQ